MKSSLPTDSAERKRVPLCTGLLDYFSAALAEVARVSVLGNEKHNPGKPLHWSREKSADHADCVARHLEARGTFDEIHLPGGRTERIRHSAEGAWRYLALLQEELEAAGAPPSRASRFPAGPSKVIPQDILSRLDQHIKDTEAQLDQRYMTEWVRGVPAPRGGLYPAWPEPGVRSWWGRFKDHVADIIDIASRPWK